MGRKIILIFVAFVVILLTSNVTAVQQTTGSTVAKNIQQIKENPEPTGIIRKLIELIIYIISSIYNAIKTFIGDIISLVQAVIDIAYNIYDLVMLILENVGEVKDFILWIIEIFTEFIDFIIGLINPSDD